MEGRSELNDYQYPIDHPPASVAENDALSRAIDKCDAHYLFPGMRFDRTYVIGDDGYFDALCAYSDRTYALCTAVLKIIVQSKQLPIISLSWCLKDNLEIVGNRADAYYGLPSVIAKARECSRILIRTGAEWPSAPVTKLDVIDLFQYYVSCQRVRAAYYVLQSLRNKSTCLGGPGRNVIPLIIQEVIKLLP